MKKIFSFIILAALVVYFFSVSVLPFLGMIKMLSYFVGFALAVGVIGSVGLIIVLVKERLNDMKKEKDDLDKY